MGSTCNKKSVETQYHREFQQINYSLIKDQWPALKKYRIKRIFERFAIQKTKLSRENSEGSSKSIKPPKTEKQKSDKFLTLEIFCEMFPEFIRYEEMQKKRIFELFDLNHDGMVDWVDFYTMISVCYFADEKFLAKLMFIIFDEFLERKLDRAGLMLLLDLNAVYIREISNPVIEPVSMKNPKENEFPKIKLDKRGKKKEQCSIIINSKSIKALSSFKTINKGPNTTKTIYDLEPVVYYEPQQIVQSLMGGAESISLEHWARESQNFIDYNQFRRFFNIFKEQKLEKQLITNFYDWNDLYNIEQGKYISYLVAFKWFQAWKTYVEMQYGIHFNIEQKNPVTLKSLKTKKSIKTNNSGRSQLKKNKLTDKSMNRKLKLNFNFPIQNGETSRKKEGFPEEIRNYDMINGNIGERPQAIYNGLLEYEYEEVLKPGLIENRDFVFVSEKVWEHLRQIYDGFPEFRRTGYDQIELYPKNVKIYSTMFKGQIAYSTEVIRQVSNYTTIQQLMVGSLDINKKQISLYSIYYRSLGMPTWEKISDTTSMFIDLTPHILIFLIYLEKQSSQAIEFEAKYLKESASINEVNLGDVVYYYPPQNRLYKNKGGHTKSNGIEALFMTKTIQGKIILHLIGRHYDENLCLTTRQFIKQCKIKTKTVKTLVSIGNQKSQTSHKNMPINKLNRATSIITNQPQQYPETSLKKNKSPLYCDNTNISFLISTLIHFNQNSDLRQALIPLSYKQNKKQQFATFTLILGYIFHLLLKSTVVQEKTLLSILEEYFPWFNTHDISMCSLFLEEFMMKISAEMCEIVSESRQSQDGLSVNIINRDYHFEIMKVLTCPDCQQTTDQPIQECEYVLKVPIPEKQSKFYEIIFVPFCQQVVAGEPMKMKKYGFELSNNATLKQYRDKFEELADLKNRPYVILEICQNTIIKNLTHAQLEAPLQSFHLREDDIIYTFQLQIDFQFFIKQHYSYPSTSFLSSFDHRNSYKGQQSTTKMQMIQQNVKIDMYEQPIKIGQLLDCFNEKKGWIVGKVIEKDIMPYTYKQKIKVQHKQSKNKSYEVNYQVDRGIVSHFPLNSYRNCEIDHLQIHQRIFNEETNQMKKCQIPIIIPLPNWMRYKQFQFLIYLQMQRFINSEYRFNIDDNEDRFNQKPNRTFHYYETRAKESNKNRLKKFKEYLNGKDIPYKFGFADKSGRCLICFKIIKSIVYKGESERFCEGCKLPKPEQPINWQVRITQLIITVDWKITAAIRPLEQLINLDKSSKKIEEKKRVACGNIQDYIYKYLYPVQTETNQLLCCNRILNMKFKRKFTKYPKILIVNLMRVAEQSGFKKSVREPVGISDVGLIFKEENGDNVEYELVGVTTYQGIKNNICFSTYIKQQQKIQEQGSLYEISSKKQGLKNRQRWLLYSGQKIFYTTKQAIDKTTTLIYYYKKQENRNIQTEKENGFQGSQQLIEKTKQYQEKLYKQMIELGDLKNLDRYEDVSESSILGEIEELRENSESEGSEEEDDDELSEEESDISI